MKEIIERRYEYSQDGRIIIDVTVDSIHEIYNYFDRKASFLKKELDQEFIDYIVDSARELKRRDFLIRITPDLPVDDQVKERVERSIKNYFLYLKELERVRIKTNLKKIFILLLLGVLLISVSVSGWFAELVTHHGSLKILQEGIVIAAWVSLWQVFAHIILEWFPYLKTIRLYDHLSRTEIVIEPAREK